MSDRIFLSPPDVGALGEESVVGVVRSGWIAPLGPESDAFEEELPERVGIRHGVALSSETAALHLGLPGSSRPGRCGAHASDDVRRYSKRDRLHGCQTVLHRLQTGDRQHGPGSAPSGARATHMRWREVAVIVSVDLLGTTVSYTAISALVEDNGVPVLVDAAESQGVKHRGNPAGSSGRSSIVSCNGNKVMTKSGGGMSLSDGVTLLCACVHYGCRQRPSRGVKGCADSVTNESPRVTK